MEYEELLLKYNVLFSDINFNCGKDITVEIIFDYSEKYYEVVKFKHFNEYVESKTLYKSSQFNTFEELYDDLIIFKELILPKIQNIKI